MSAMRTANCPQCGGDLRFQSRASLYAVCPFCASLIVRTDVDVRKVGEVAHVQEDHSPIRLGTRGKYRGRAFEVVGRIQVEFPAGFWNEWHLWFARGENGWMGEAQGRYGINFKVDDAGPVPPFAKLRPGLSVKLKGKAYEVTDVQDARCTGGEGELPFAVESGYQAPVADLSTHGREFASIDYSEDPPFVFLGEWMEFDELELTELRELEGW